MTAAANRGTIVRKRAGPETANPPDAGVRRPAFGWPRGLVALTLPLALAGCAGAKVFEITAVAPPPVRPATIVVKATAPGSQEANRLDAAARLEQQLVVDLRKRGLPAVDASSSAASAPARLELRIQEYRRGDAAMRWLIGLGAGESRLAVRATLLTPDGAILDLGARASSADGPGLILPAGIGAVTGRILNAAIGGAMGIATKSGQGPGRDLKNVSKALALRVSAYYETAGRSLRAD